MEKPPKQKPASGSSLEVILVVILSCLIFAFMGLLGSKLFSASGSSPRATPVPTRDYSGGSTYAYRMCQKFIEERLKSPATAEWPNKSDIETYTIRGKEDAFQIRGYVDSQNGFGALLRMNYVCEVSYIGQDNWHLDLLEFDE